MLPFMKSKQARSAGIIMAVRKPEGGTEDVEQPESTSNQGLEACAEALIAAVEAKDVAATARALQDAFDVMESAPHEEGPSEEPEAG